MGAKNGRDTTEKGTRLLFAPRFRAGWSDRRTQERNFPYARCNDQGRHALDGLKTPKRVFFAPRRRKGRRGEASQVSILIKGAANVTQLCWQIFNPWLYRNSPALIASGNRPSSRPHLVGGLRETGI